MKRIIFFSLCLILLNTSCAWRTRTVEEPSHTVNLDSMEERIPPSIHIIYQDDISYGIIWDEWVNQYVPELFSDDNRYYEQKGTHLLKQITMEDDTLLVQKVFALVDGLGTCHPDRFNIYSEMALVIHQGEGVDTVGVGYDPCNIAFDSVKRGALYPCPELYDIVVNYIAEHDLEWKNKHTDSDLGAFSSNPRYSFEWLLKDSHNFCSEADNSLINDDKSDSELPVVRIEYTHNYSFEKDWYFHPAHRSIELFEYELTLDGNRCVITVDEPYLCSRIDQLIRNTGQLDKKDERFQERVQTMIIIEKKGIIDTLGVGEWPLDGIHSSKRGHLYPCVELFDIIYNYLADHDDQWLESVKDGPAFNSWSRIRCDLYEKYGVKGGEINNNPANRP